MAAARRLAKRAFRQVDRAFLVEGPKAVREAASERALGELFVTSASADRHAELVALVTASGASVHPVSEAVMSALAQTATPQGMVGVAAFRHIGLSAALGAQPRLVVMLAAVRDPGNAGTVLRVADAAGADAVVFSATSVDPYNGKCVRASAGSLFHLPFAVGVPAAEAVATMRGLGLTILAAAAEGDTGLDEIAAGDALARPTAWIFGNESWGLPSELSGLADGVVRVPLHGRAESLNLATAAAVCLYASAAAQRRRCADARAERQEVVDD